MDGSRKRGCSIATAEPLTVVRRLRLATEYEDWETVTLEDLFADARYEEAERALAMIAEEDPEASSWALGLRAICLAELRREDEALAVARAAVQHDPDSALASWVLGALLCERNRLDEAMTAARRAVQLEPENAIHHGLVAQIHAKRGDWAACREAAEQGLRVDPADETCNSLRTLALRGTASGDEWPRAVDELVRKFPASGWARAGRGWSWLEAGRAREAREDFEQALALDPTSEWAREGLIESVKAANPLYAALLRLFLWMDRLPPRTRWFIILGGIFLFRVLRRTTEATPEIAPLTYPLMAAWALFIIASWTSQPLSDFVLSRSQLGRRLVKGDRLLAANLVAAVLGAALVLGVSAAWSDSERLIGATLGTAFLIIPVAGVFRCAPGWPRNVMAAYTGIAALCAVGILVAPLEASRIALVAVLVLSVLGSWLAAFLASRRVVR